MKEMARADILITIATQLAIVDIRRYVLLKVGAWLLSVHVSMYGRTLFLNYCIQYYSLWTDFFLILYTILNFLEGKIGFPDFKPNFEESKAVWSDVENLVLYTKEIPSHQSNKNEK